LSRRRELALERCEDLILGRPLQCLLVARTGRISPFALEAPGNCLVAFELWPSVASARGRGSEKSGLLSYPLQLASTTTIPGLCFLCLALSFHGLILR